MAAGALFPRHALPALCGQHRRDVLVPHTENRRDGIAVAAQASPQTGDVHVYGAVTGGRMGPQHGHELLTGMDTPGMKDKMSEKVELKSRKDELSFLDMDCAGWDVDLDRICQLSGTWSSVHISIRRVIHRPRIRARCQYDVDLRGSLTYQHGDEVLRGKQHPSAWRNRLNSHAGAGR